MVVTLEAQNWSYHAMLCPVKLSTAFCIGRADSIGCNWEIALDEGLNLNFCIALCWVFMGDVLLAVVVVRFEVMVAMQQIVYSPREADTVPSGFITAQFL